MIYKFMSDIDTQNKELGADGFFVGEYEKYAWSNIMDRKIGTHDKLYLYSEWLEIKKKSLHLLKGELWSMINVFNRLGFLLNENYIDFLEI